MNSMTRGKLIKYCLTALTVSTRPIDVGGTAQAQDKKPYVVFILADNVGYGDLGPYGGGELRG